MVSMSDVNAGELSELSFALPTIPASAGALVRGRKGRLLILKPTYKGGWTIPGGVVEIGESPWDACRRETREECGLDVTTGRLKCVDFLRPRPDRPGGMRFLFDCGVFDDAVLDTVVIQPVEIAQKPDPADRRGAAFAQRTGPTSCTRRLEGKTGALSGRRPPGTGSQPLTAGNRRPHTTAR